MANSSTNGACWQGVSGKEPTHARRILRNVSRLSNAMKSQIGPVLSPRVRSLSTIEPGDIIHPCRRIRTFRTNRRALGPCVDQRGSFLRFKDVKRFQSAPPTRGATGHISSCAQTESRRVIVIGFQSTPTAHCGGRQLASRPAICCRQTSGNLTGFAHADPGYNDAYRTGRVTEMAGACPASLRRCMKASATAREAINCRAL